VNGRGVAVAWCGAGTSTGFHKGSVAAVVLLQLLIQQGAEPSFLLRQRAEAVASREDDRGRLFAVYPRKSPANRWHNNYYCTCLKVAITFNLNPCLNHHVFLGNNHGSGNSLEQIYRRPHSAHTSHDIHELV